MLSASIGLAPQMSDLLERRHGGLAHLLAWLGLTGGVGLLALDCGVNYFDTAPDYSHELSERTLGQAIYQYGERDRLFTATKF